MPNFLTRLAGPDALTLAERETDRQIAIARTRACSRAATAMAQIEMTRAVTREALRAGADIATVAETVLARTSLYGPELLELGRSGIMGLDAQVRRLNCRCGL